MTKAIIFDFFGVIHNDPYNAWLINHGYVREGAFLEASQKVDSGRINGERFYEMLGKLSGQSTKSIHEEFKSIAKVDYEVIKIIQNLRKNYKIALLSNSPSVLIREILEENDLEKYFDEIIISSEVGLIKPNKEIFYYTIVKLGINHSDVLFIDDSKHHTEGAEKAGIKSIVFTSANQLEEELTKTGVDFR